MQEIEEQATISWGSNTRAIAAWDFMCVVIPAVVPAAIATTTSRKNHPATETTKGMDLGYADPVEGFMYTQNKRRS
jgi:hypothetical protein